VKQLWGLWVTLLFLSTLQASRETLALQIHGIASQFPFLREAGYMDNVILCTRHVVLLRESDRVFPTLPVGPQALSRQRLPTVGLYIVRIAICYIQILISYFRKGINLNYLSVQNERMLAPTWY
jgi:hypothetical protein